MEAFTREFRGKGFSWMEKGLERYNEMYNLEKHYGKTIAVVQSSGTGKSRTMAEMAKRVRAAAHSPNLSF
jgi:ABC-type microcin C transport system duplicated ATPase subunit YejF